MNSLIGRTITEADRAGWLAARHHGIGSSDAAAAIGISPYETPLGLYLKKIGAAPPPTMNAAMKWGLRLEPLLAEEYGEATGHAFSGAQVFLRSEDHPWMIATLDRVRDDGRIVELKTVGHRSAADWGEPGSDEIPHHYLVQVSHQLVVANADVADVAVLIGGQDFRIYTVERDDRIIGRLVEREAEFWNRVEARMPPEPVSPDDLGAMALLYPDAEGSVEFDDEDLSLVAEWEHTGADVRYHQEARKRCRMELLRRLGPAASATLPDGRILSRKVVSVAEQQITRKAYIYADLKIRRGRS